METVYRGYRNVSAKKLKKAGKTLFPAQMTAITKVGVVYLGTLYDSTTYPDAFDWITRADEGIISFSLGVIPGIQIGRDKRAEIIVYAEDYVEGIVWGTLDIQVIDLGV